MTAQIALLNKEAIALASDSAVTTIYEKGPKIFTSANKLFSLSPEHPVGIMIYGNARFMGIPWETIIKLYRKKVGKEKFNTIKDYLNDFVKFLEENRELFPEEIQDMELRKRIASYLTFIRNDIFLEVEKIIKNEGKLYEKDIETKVVNKVINEHFENIKNKFKKLPHIDKKEYIDALKEKTDKITEEIVPSIFEKIRLSDEIKKKLKEISHALFYKDIFPRDRSGVIIGGFGEKEVFPALVVIEVEVVVNNRLKYIKIGEVNISNECTAVIYPFAQKEMVVTFIEGIHPEIRKEFIENWPREILNRYAEELVKIENPQSLQVLKEKNRILMKEYLDKFKEYIRKRHVDPIINVVSYLPKNELALIAEALVNLTSFKRRVSTEEETVGGPIDVAVISKGDGFVWIKRKHYFKPELNPHFIAKYYKM